jgi:hypothetical protein
MNAEVLRQAALVAPAQASAATTARRKPAR